MSGTSLRSKHSEPKYMQELPERKRCTYLCYSLDHGSGIDGCSPSLFRVLHIVSLWHNHVTDVGTGSRCHCLHMTKFCILMFSRVTFVNVQLHRHKNLYTAMTFWTCHIQHQPHTSQVLTHFLRVDCASAVFALASAVLAPGFSLDRAMCLARCLTLGLPFALHKTTRIGMTCRQGTC